MSYTPSPGYSPYAPPQQPYGGGQYQYQQPYQPLGWKTTAAAIGIIATVICQIALDAVQWAMGKEMQTNMAALATIGLVSLVSSVAALCAAIFFFMWIYQAAKNVRSFGQGALEFTPGWCIGWWFIPFMSLVKPYQAMKEIWRASDPEAVKNGPTGWMTAPTAGILPLWWAMYLIGGLIGGVVAVATMSDPSSGGPGKMVGHLFSVVAAIAVVSIMRQIAARQEGSWQVLTAMPQQAAQPYPGGPYQGPAYGPQY